tara:strand:- start:269 stop:505 length:237 start_codon:yes stop_codon:yes gene_type:complete
MELIKPLNKKVSIFATDEELYAKLTNKELSLIKLVKVEEFMTDLLHMTEKTNGELSMVASSKYNRIQELLLELRKLNK